MRASYDETYGFHDDDVHYSFKSEKGLNEDIVRQISQMKNEPDWMLQQRLEAYRIFLSKPTPQWGGELNKIDYDDIYYYVRATDQKGRSWDEVPAEVKRTFDRLGIPEAEQKYLQGVSAQYDSESVYHSIRKDLEEKGVIFLDMDSGLAQYPDLVKEYFGTVIPSSDNKFAALNTAVWSGGSFIYVPPGVHIDMPLQAYFRINTQNMGQFERTLIIVDKDSYVHYVEGCLPAGELISKGDRWVNIESISPGDTVMDSDGNQAVVKNVRVVPFKGDMLTIRPISQANAFQLTPEHPVLTVKRKDVAVARSRRGWKAEVDTKKLLAAHPEFLPAGELEEGDFIIFPISKLTRENPKYTVPMMRLLGYYLAEGSAYIHKQLNQAVVSFTFNQTEREYIDEVKSLIEEITGKKAMEIAQTERHGVEVRVYSRSLMDLCVTDCGKGAATKQLSKDIMELPVALQKELLETYFNGDGSVYTKRKHLMIRAATVSQQLAWQLQELLARQGYYATISIRKGGKDTILGREITRRDQYIIYYSPDKQQSEIRKGNGYFLVPIKKIDRTPFEGPVFNFELTSAPNAYTARGFAVHNCTAPSYSSNSLHSAVVEIMVKEGARCRYTTIQNWSNNVYNLVTKRAIANKNATMEWVDGNLGCLAEGSQVTTPHGTRTIESLNIGDEVLSFNEKTGQLCFRKVTAKKFSGYQPVHTVSVGERQLQVTANHPFFSYIYEPESSKKLEPYQLAYVRADQLKQAIVPRTSMEYGQLYEMNQYSPNLTMVRDHSSKLKLGQRTNEELARLLGLSEAVEIVKVEVSEASSELVPTWDIEVEETANFVAQGFIVHNSHLTMKYPAVILAGEGAHGEVLSIAFAGEGQHQDAGAKITHLAPNTTSQIISKSISKDGGRASYRGLLKIVEGADNVKSNVVCDALLLDDRSRSDTYPVIEVDAKNVTMGHEASVSRIGEDQLFYLMSRGMSEDEANAMIVNGFIEPLVKELPMEYALEMNRLIQIQLEGSIG
ncbi:MAG: Fe-S cluster assembly protein SufB [Anaerolineae bacterium]|nr:Fe-S cluster assembly protein SufB [Anaerolineae bacterium]